MKNDEVLSLLDLEEGEQAELVSFGDIESAYRQRLLAMGLSCGTRFTLVRRAPLGDPMQIKVYSANLSVRATEAKTLRVKRIYDTAE